MASSEQDLQISGETQPH